MQITTTEDRALALLGAGIPAEQVASACGVTAGRISQMISDETFAAKIADLRFTNLQKHNARDTKYDEMEDKLMAQLDSVIPLMQKPMEVLHAVRVINNAQRRGQSNPSSITNQQTHISLVMPTVVVNKFQTNINNQVVAVDNQDLLTIQAGSLLDSVKSRQAQNEVSNNDTGNSQQTPRAAISR